MTWKRWMTTAVLGLGISACGEQAAEQVEDEHGPPVPPAPELMQDVANGQSIDSIRADSAPPTERPR